MSSKIPVENLPNYFGSISKLAAWCLKNRIGLHGHNTPQARSKFFEDHRRGVLVIEDPKRITREEALQYFAVAGLAVVEVGNPAYDGGLFARKTGAEIRALEARASKAEHELKIMRGEYIPRDDVRLQLAVKLTALEAGIKTMIRVNAVDWIYKVGGDPQKAGMFCELAYAEIDALLNEFGNMEEIRVVIVKNPPPLDVGAENRAECCAGVGEEKPQIQRRRTND